jgi:hypothetical protein
VRPHKGLIDLVLDFVVLAQRHEERQAALP